MDTVSDEEKRRAAMADLARMEREGDALGALFGRGAAHFAAADAPKGDPIEKWGRRIGRALGAVAFIALCVYLYVSYVR